MTLASDIRTAIMTAAPVLSTRVYQDKVGEDQPPYPHAIFALDANSTPRLNADGQHFVYQRDYRVDIFFADTDDPGIVALFTALSELRGPTAWRGLARSFIRFHDEVANVVIYTIDASVLTFAVAA